ncbi:MAG: regulatory protein RecX [Betaproteobacteria bacterium]|nr:regulatory protein RecX [Betaproteobacteria bacterium]
MAFGSKRKQAPPAATHAKGSDRHEPAAGVGSKRKDEPTPVARALRLLARREHTRLELERKLSVHVEDPAELQSLLDELTDRGWLSESRAVDQLVRMKRARFGTARIRQSLLEKGVAHDLIAPALETLKETELDAARGVWSRKFKTTPETSADRARHVRFLQSRGFSLGIALRVVRGGDDAEEQ